MNIFVFLSRHRAEFAVAILVVLSGCAGSMGKFDSVVYEKLPEEGVKLTSGPQLASLNSSGSPQSCIHSYFLFADKANYDLESLTKTACSSGKAIRQAEFRRDYFYVPLIYGWDCVNIAARCEK